MCTAALEGPEKDTLICFPSLTKGQDRTVTCSILDLQLGRAWGGLGFTCTDKQR